MLLSTHLHATNTFAVFVVVFIIVVTAPLAGAVCNSDDYCPNGWNVQRKSNYDPTTCDPTAGIKCDKPFQCVHSHCGMSFCCVSKDRMKLWVEYKDVAEDMDADDESREEL